MTKKKLDVWQRYCESAFWAWPFENTCIISDRPEEIHWDTRGNRLHNDSGPSVKFRDGWAIYNLNGVRVPDWLAVTPAMEIDVKKFAEISNAEVRREFVRKVGVERLVQKLGAVTLDTQGDYALLSVDLGGETGKWPYLKMLNPSIKVWHLECVGKECKTVQDAINFRASQLKSLNNDWNPEVIT